MNQMLHPYFTLSGQFDPDEITRLLEVEPSWTKRIGDPGPADAKGPRLGAEWAWQPQNDDSCDIGDQLAFMAGALASMGGQLAQLSKEFGGVISLYDQTGSSERDWFLSARSLRMLSELHVDIECKSARNETNKEVETHAN